MDSKMDSGYLAPGETLDDDYDVSIALLPEEVVGIMDQLLCHEVGFSNWEELDGISSEKDRGDEGKILITGNMSAGIYRLRGIWAILCRRRYLRPSILIGYSGQFRRRLKRRSLIAESDQGPRARRPAKVKKRKGAIMQRAWLMLF